MPYGYKLAWICIFAISSFLLLFRIGSDAVWCDESYSIAVASHPLPEIISSIAKDRHPPLYFLMLRPAYLIAGNSRIAARSISALGALAFISLGFFPLRRLWGNRGGIIFSILALSTPMLLFTGREARMYSWLPFFVTAMVIYGHIARTGNRKKDWIIMSLYTLCAAYTHYFGLLAASIYWSILLSTIAFNHITGRNTDRDDTQIKTSFIAALVIITAYLPWLPIAMQQFASVQQNYWIPPLSKANLLRALVFPFSVRQSAINQRNIAIVIAVLFLSTFSVFAHIRAKKKDTFLCASTLSVYGLTFLATIILSLITRPILVDRYFSSVAGLLILCVSSLVCLTKNQLVKIATVTIYLLVNIPSALLVYTINNQGDLNQVITDLSGEVSKNDVFIHADYNTLGFLHYVFPDNEHYLYIPDDYPPFGNYHVFGPRFSMGTDLGMYADRPVTIWYCMIPNGFYKVPLSTLTNAAHRNIEGIRRVYSTGFGETNIYIYKVVFDPAKKAPSGKRGKLSVVASGIKKGGSQTFIYALFNDDPLHHSNALVSGKIKNTTDMIYIDFNNVPYGKNYALLLFHDENSNNTLDTIDNVPTEGIAVWRLPAFSDFQFDDMKFYFDESETTKSFIMLYPNQSP